MKVYHKFHAKPTEYQGIRFHSKKEAQYAIELDFLKKAGEVLFWLRQVPFDLPGNIRYRVDFVVFLSSGEVIFVDTKGYDTPGGKMKRKMVEELYPITIETP